MAEILISQSLDTKDVSVLPESAEEKARQVPDPVTYHLLCVLPEAEEEYSESESGIIKASQTMHCHQCFLWQKWDLMPLKTRNGFQAGHRASREILF